MRIVHVVGGVAPDQRFGGSSRVALDLARRQQARGNAVHLVASDVGFARPVPRRIEGVPASLPRSAHIVPALGFGTIVSPGIVPVLVRLMRRADVAHVHFSREPNSLIAALIAITFHVPLVLQTHGMLDEPNNLLARLVDVMATGPLLRRAPTILTLTDEEDVQIARLSRSRSTGTRLPNGIQASVDDVRAPVLVRNSVLFLARLHPRKGAVRFSEAAFQVAQDYPSVKFRVVGPDEGDGGAVRRVVSQASGTLSYEGPIGHDEVGRAMASAMLYCLPAANEPFGLTVIEALAAGTPVLLHETAALADTIVEAEAGWTFDDERGGRNLEAVLRQVLSDRDELLRRGERARQLALKEFDLDGVLDRLDVVYQSVISANVPAIRRG